MMAYGLVLAPSFRKAYSKLERQEQALVERKMIVLASDPWHLSFTCYGGGKTVASLADMLSQRTEDQLILVDLLDRPRGSMGKLACHQQGRLHRAFSLFLYRMRGNAIELLVQRRAEGKYHSGGLLANSVCSHPRVGESLEQAVPRRLTQELGVPAKTAQGLRYREAGSFVYRTRFANCLTEYEYDHVFVAEFEGSPEDGAIAPDPEEVAAVAWVDAGELLADLQAHPSRYASWFLTAAPMAMRAIAPNG